MTNPLTPDLIQAIRTGYRADSVGLAQLSGLIAALRPTIEPAHTPEFLALAAARGPEPQPPAGPLLGLTPEAYVQTAVDASVVSLTQTAVRDRLAGQRSALAAEMIASMRSEAASYVDALTPEFDDAAAQAHALVDAGVSAADTAETMTRRSSKVLADWLLFRDRYVPILDRIAATRIRLSLVLGVEPATLGNDFSAAFASPFVPGLLDFGGRRRGAPTGWARWVAAASRARLHLVPLAEVDAVVREAWQAQPDVIEDEEDGRLIAVGG